MKKNLFTFMLRNLKPVNGMNYIELCWNYVNDAIEKIKDFGSFELSKFETKSGSTELY